MGPHRYLKYEMSIDAAPLVAQWQSTGHVVQDPDSIPGKSAHKINLNIVKIQNPKSDEKFSNMINTIENIAMLTKASYIILIDII